MITLNKIIYDVREKLKFNTEDIGVTDDYIAHLINIKRNMLVKQRFSKFNKNIPEEVKQIICVPLDVVDSIDGEPCFGSVVKSETIMPDLLEIGGRSALLSVRVQDITYPNINIIPIERLPYVGYNRWLNKQLYIALDADNHLYLKSANPLHTNLKKIKVIGVFADPEEADNMSCDTDDSVVCDEYNDKPYRIEAYLVSDLVSLVVRELAPTLQIPNDIVNNSDESNRT